MRGIALKLLGPAALGVMVFASAPVSAADGPRSSDRPVSDGIVAPAKPNSALPAHPAQHRWSPARPGPKIEIQGGPRL
jgi:hypothetical protein